MIITLKTLCQLQQTHKLSDYTFYISSISRPLVGSTSHWSRKVDLRLPCWVAHGAHCVVSRERGQKYKNIHSQSAQGWKATELTFCQQWMFGFHMIVAKKKKKRKEKKKFKPIQNLLVKNTLDAEHWIRHTVRKSLFTSESSFVSFLLFLLFVFNSLWSFLILKKSRGLKYDEGVPSCWGCTGVSRV